MKFSIKDFFSKCDQIRNDLVTFTEEIITFCAVAMAPCTFNQRPMHRVTL